MQLWDRIRADYRNSKGVFLLKSIITIAMFYCAYQLIVIMMADFRGNYSGAVQVTLYPFFMFFLSALMSLIRLYQISFNRQHPQFKSLLSDVILTFAASLLMLFVYYISSSVRLI